MLQHYNSRLLCVGTPQMAFGQEHTVQCTVMHQAAAAEACMMAHQGLHGNGIHGECEWSL